MRALIALALVLLAVLPAWAGEPGWTGRWDTRWRDDGARMEVTPSSKRITGTYPAYGGQIEGEVTGRERRGRWIEGNRTGGLSFVLEVSCCLDVRLLANKPADKTALMLGVLRLANRMRMCLGALNDPTPGLGAAAE